jgi:hypothetical protein
MPEWNKRSEGTLHVCYTKDFLMYCCKDEEINTKTVCEIENMLSPNLSLYKVFYEQFFLSFAHRLGD